MVTRAGVGIDAEAFTGDALAGLEGFGLKWLFAALLVEHAFGLGDDDLGAGAERIGDVEAINGELTVAIAVGEAEEFHCAVEVVVKAALDDQAELMRLWAEMLVDLFALDEGEGGRPALVDLFMLVKEIGGRQHDAAGVPHSCIRLSGCPSLSIAPNPDPLRTHPIAKVDNSCVGCGLCGDTRLTRVREEVKAAPDQLVTVTEYMHPRYVEVCETLPRPLGHFLLKSSLFKSLLAPFFKQGRHVTTTRLRWFAVLWLLARARPHRRGSLRHHEETARITAWLALIADLATNNLAAACALAECQSLIKGYSDTFERGLRQYGLITAAIHRHRNAPGLAQHITTLRHAAEADEHDHALTAALKSLDPAPAALAA